MCGIFGAFNVDRAALHAYWGLYALQHRGQESAGICTTDGKEFFVVKKQGLVLEAIKREDLERLKGRAAVAHVRYSTAGDAGGANAQPILAETSKGTFALVHNGNLVNYKVLRKELTEEGVKFSYTSDSEVFVHLIDRSEGWVPEGMQLHPRDKDFLPYLFDALRTVEGAYSILLLLKDRLIAARDPHGFRPLQIGRSGESWFFASESVAFDIVGAEFKRELKPGEVVVVDGEGLRSYFPFRNSSARRAACIFEYIYFARPDSYIFGDWVYEVRKRLGRELAREVAGRFEVDAVVPVPDSGIVPAIGFSQESGVPLELGLIRNHYVGRSFIEPTQELRDLKVLMKLSPVKPVLRGKRIAIIDDSLVRGTTSRRIVKMLKRAGAEKVFVLIASPPVRYPCFYGIDIPTKEELIANRLDLEGIRDHIGADGLYYLSVEGMLRAVKGKREEYCTACFTGDYPTPAGG
ncbi:MAG: amidophosphoribosyltransferase [Aquificae bacterium]|nr:amidophosphoribosyltransferase [Aquificota bacterium]